MAKAYNHRRAENEYAKWKEKDEKFMEKMVCHLRTYL